MMTKGLFPRNVLRTRSWGKGNFQTIYPKRRTFVYSGIGDDMLDFIQAGPKLRKWYGETDKLLLPRDGPGNDDEGEDEASEGPKEAIVVVGADSELGKLTVMQLVLERAEVRVLVSDAARMKQEFGPYVKAVEGNVNDGRSLQKVMKGARALIVAGAIGQSCRAAKALGLEHIVLPSEIRPSGLSFSSMFGSPESSMQGEDREQDAMSVDVPCSIVRFSELLDKQGGTAQICLSQKSRSSVPRPTALARQDLAIVLVQSLSFPPGEGQSVVFEAGAVGKNGESNWKEQFTSLSPVQTGS